jgi:hypothetical protein
VRGTNDDDDDDDNGDDHSTSHRMAGLLPLRYGRPIQSLQHRIRKTVESEEQDDIIELIAK